MIVLSGYQILEKIYEGVRTVVYRAKKDGSDNQLSLKLLNMIILALNKSQI